MTGPVGTSARVERRLPATPIATPGREALNAMEHPAHGQWLYDLAATIEQLGGGE